MGRGRLRDVYCNTRTPMLEVRIKDYIKFNFGEAPLHSVILDSKEHCQFRLRLRNPLPPLGAQRQASEALFGHIEVQKD